MGGCLGLSGDLGLLGGEEKLIEELDFSFVGGDWFSCLTDRICVRNLPVVVCVVVFCCWGFWLRCFVGSVGCVKYISENGAGVEFCRGIVREGWCKN